MNQKKYPVRKEFRMTPQEEEMLKKKAKDMNMTESEYMRLLISQKPMDYMEIRVLLKNLINEVNSVGININQITRNANACKSQYKNVGKMEYKNVGFSTYSSAV